MGSQPCLKKAMHMMMSVQNKHDSTVQFHVCVQRPMCSSVLKIVTTSPPSPPTHAFLKWPVLTDFKKYTHTPPYVMTCLHIEAKLVKNPKKCQNTQSWHIMSVPKRYATRRKYLP